jgi:hypothetical protein
LTVNTARDHAAEVLAVEFESVAAFGDFLIAMPSRLTLTNLLHSGAIGAYV